MKIMKTNEKSQNVVYKNELNTVPLRNFNAIEMDLFFTILSTMRDKGLTEITFDFQDLKELSNYQPTANERFASDLEKTYDKLISLNIKLGDETKWTKFVIFTTYTIDLDNQTITIGTNPKFAPLINRITENFTKFELEEMTSLNSSYSKTVYRLLKQFRKTGFYRVSVDEFRRLMDIPESYKMYNIRQRVFEPVNKELSRYFKNFKIHEIKGKGKNKRKTVELIFTFLPEQDLKTDKKGKIYITTRGSDGSYYDVYAEDMTAEQIRNVYNLADETQKKYLDDLLVLKEDQMEIGDIID